MSKKKLVCGLVLAASLLFVGLPVRIVGAQAPIKLTINYIETEAIPEESAYEVRAYVTVSDADNLPITGLDKADFSAWEDAMKVPIIDVAPAIESMSVLLMLDTSGSMGYQGKWEAARAAADKFIEALAPKDRVAVMTFSEKSDLEVDFTENHNAARNEICKAEATPGQGTCLYDATFQGVKKMAEAPRGRRALILLTDGIDETLTADRCSDMTFEDVVNKATAETTRVPLYTIGLGERVNEQELARFAELTGGRSLLAPTPEELMGLFQTIADQLKKQYVIKYTSNNVSGEHSLAIKVQHQGATLQDEKKFSAPSVPPTIKLVTDLDTIKRAIREHKPVNVAVRVTSQGEVAVVKFYVNDELVGEVTSAPYTFEWETSKLESGEYTLRAEVYDDEGKRSTDELGLSITVPTPGPGGNGKKDIEEGGGIPPSLIIFLLALVGGSVGGVVLVRRRKRRVEEEKLWEEEFVPEGELELETADITAMEETRDVSVSLLTPVATLNVVRSTELPPGQEFPLYAQEVTSIGRHRDNNIVIPDPPVSRWHSEIAFEADEFRIYDVGSTYGTRVNDEHVPREGTVLEDGDRIQLGTRTVLEFKRLQRGEVPEGRETKDIGGEFETQDVEDIGLEDESGA